MVWRSALKTSQGFRSLISNRKRKTRRNTLCELRKKRDYRLQYFLYLDLQSIPQSWSFFLPSHQSFIYIQQGVIKRSEQWWNWLRCCHSVSVVNFRGFCDNINTLYWLRHCFWKICAEIFKEFPLQKQFNKISPQN